MMTEIRLAFALLGALSFFDCGAETPEKWENDWVLAIQYMYDDQELEAAKDLVRRAKKEGYTGLALISGKNYTGWTDRFDPDGEMRDHDDGSAAFRASRTGLEDLAHMDPRRLSRFRELKRCCDEAKIDFIPLLWSAGYCSMQYADTAFAACWPVRDVPYVVKGGVAVFCPEKVAADLSPLNRTVDCNQPSNRDVEVRFPIKGARKYRVTARMSTNGALNSPRAGNDGPGFGVMSENSVPGCGYDSSFYPHLPATCGNRTVEFEFLTREEDKECRLHDFARHDKQGFVTFSDVTVEEVGVEYPIVRAGAPFVVKDAVTGRLYREGVDYAPVASTPTLRFVKRTPELEIRILPGGSVREGMKLLVSSYEAKKVYGDQFGTCLLNPALTGYYRRSAEDLRRTFGVTKWFLSADEIRVGCRCERCRADRDTAGVRIGKDVRRQYDAIKAVSRDADIYVWSDMLDENHNSQVNQYLMETPTTGSLDYLPKDVTVVCWWSDKYELCLPYFVSRGFRVMGAGYYDRESDADTLKNADVCTEALNATPGVRGIVYASWDYGIGRNFDRIGLWADEVRRRAVPYVPTREGRLPRRVIGCDCRGRDLETVAEEIRREQPDVVLLPETDVYATRTKRVNQLKELARMTGLHPTFAPAAKIGLELREGGFGPGVLSKERPLSYEMVRVEDTDTHRAILICHFDKFVAACAGFPEDPDLALAAVRTLNGIVAKEPKPVYLFGDLDPEKHVLAIEELKKRFAGRATGTRGDILWYTCARRSALW